MSPLQSGPSGDVLQNPPMIPGFQAALPVRVSFGDGVVSELGDVVAGRRVLVVVEEPVAGIPAVARAIAGMDVHAKPAGRADVRRDRRRRPRGGGGAAGGDRRHRRRLGAGRRESRPARRRSGRELRAVLRRGGAGGGAARRPGGRPDDQRHRLGGVGRGRRGRSRGAAQARRRASADARAARAGRPAADGRPAARGNRLHRRRCAGAGDRRRDRLQRQRAVGGHRPGGVPSRRRRAGAGCPRRRRPRGAARAGAGQPDGRPGDEPLRLLRRPRAGALDRLDLRAAARADRRPRPGRDAGGQPAGLRAAA